MKYSDLCPPPKLTVRRSTAVAMFECEPLFVAMEKAGWIHPIPAGAQMNLYSVDELKRASARLLVEQVAGYNPRSSAS